MTTPIALATRHRTRPSLPLLPGPPVAGLTLLRGRVHEGCGPARKALGAMLAGACAGPVLWIGAGWEGERLMPGGLVGFADPGRFIFVAARRAEDILWAAEEALRSGAVPLVVADLIEPPGLTPVRRLHLAAEAPDSAPTGLLLTPGTGGAAGVESRWHLAQAPMGEWRLARLRARAAPPATWALVPERGGIAVRGPGVGVGVGAGVNDVAPA